MSSNPQGALKQDADFKRLISQIVADIEFLSKDIKFSIGELKSMLQTQNFYRFEQGGDYFLGNWGQALQSSINEEQAMRQSTYIGHPISSCCWPFNQYGRGSRSPS